MVDDSAGIGIHTICDDSDMCDEPVPCPGIESNNLVLLFNAHPCAMAPICAILTQMTATRLGGLSGNVGGEGGDEL